MDKVCLFVICMYCSIHHLSAQQEEQQTQPVQQPLVTQDDILGNMNVDYAKIKLPPLSVLYENARSTPSLQILEKEKLLQKKVTIEREKELAGVYPKPAEVLLTDSRQCGQQYGCQHPTYLQVCRYRTNFVETWGGGISIPF